MYYNKLLSSSTDKSKTFWNIINNEIDTASSKKCTRTEFKLGNKIIGTNQWAKIFNNYFINSVDELITQQTNTEWAIFSLRELFPYKFPQIINIPITETEVVCAISLHVVMMVYPIRYWNYVVAKFLNLSLTYTINH